MEQDLELTFPTSLRVQGRELAFSRRTTTRQDTARENCLHRHQLKVLVPLKDETSDAFHDRVFDTILRTDAWADLLSCYLTQPGEKWNQARADEIRELLLDMDDDDEKRAVLSVLPWLVLAFFAKGLVSLKTSQMYSDEPEDHDDLLPDAPTGPTTSGRGASWFGRLLTQIRLVWRLFWTARSGTSSPATATGSGRRTLPSSDTTGSNT